MRTIVLLVFMVLSCFVYLGSPQQSAGVTCFRVGTTGIKATLRVKNNGASVSRLTAYNQAGDTETSCSTTEIANDQLYLDITFDETDSAPLNCGVEKDEVISTQFNMRVHATGPGVHQPYVFHCDTMTLTPTIATSGALGVSGSLPKFGLYERNREVRLQAVYPGTNTTVTHAELGQTIKLRLIYNRGIDNADKFDHTNWGFVFHTGFLKSGPGATLSMDIYTQAIETEVKVTGILADFLVDETVTVTRTAPVRLEFASDYQPGGTTTVWEIATKGFQIEGLNAHIGIRVNSDNGFGSTDSFTAYPDELLGNETFNRYRLPTLEDTAETAQALIVATTDGTEVTAHYDQFTPPAGFTEVAYPVNLDSFGTFHLVCGQTCTTISITSNKPVAVIIGHSRLTVTGGTNQGLIMTQSLPVTEFGRKFIIAKPQMSMNLQARYKIVYSVPEFSSPTNWFYAAGPATGTPIHDGSNPITLSGSSRLEELEIDMTGSPPVAFLVQTLLGDLSYEPTMTSIPPIDKWGNSLTFSAFGNTRYVFYVISTKDNIDNIQLSVSNYCCWHTSSFRSLDVIPARPSRPVEYRFQSLRFKSFPSGATWIKFESVDLSKTLTVLFYEILSDGRIQTYTPFTQRKFQQCDLPTATQGPDTPIYPGVIQGDGVDNDCDNIVDEETLNGFDDDGDAKIDEDLKAPGTSKFIGAKAIRNIKLEIAGDDSFSDAIEVINDGCNVHDSATGIGSIGHFTWEDTDLPNSWVIGTNEFSVFRFNSNPVLCIRATVDFCDEEEGLCLDSCSESVIKRRAAATTDLSDLNLTSSGFQESTKPRKPEPIVLKLLIGDPERNDKGPHTTLAKSCLNSILYWSLTAFFILLILLELGVIIYLVRKKRLLYSQK